VSADIVTAEPVVTRSSTTRAPAGVTAGRSLAFLRAGLIVLAASAAAAALGRLGTVAPPRPEVRRYDDGQGTTLVEIRDAGAWQLPRVVLARSPIDLGPSARTLRVGGARRILPRAPTVLVYPNGDLEARGEAFPDLALTILRTSPRGPRPSVPAWLQNSRIRQELERAGIDLDRFWTSTCYDGK
jgi:hypothetical protein